MLALFVGLNFAQCSSDDDSSEAAAPTGTLFVNGEAFAIGENTTGNSYNTMIRNSTAGVRTMAFTILKNGNFTTPETLTVTVHDLGTPPANNTYPFVGESGSFDVYALGGYNIMPQDVTFGSPNISGNVKVTDVGNNVFKLEFDNVVMEEEGNPDSTKTITGYCEMKFTVFNFGV